MDVKNFDSAFFTRMSRKGSLPAAFLSKVKVKQGCKFGAYCQIPQWSRNIGLICCFAKTIPSCSIQEVYWQGLNQVKSLYPKVSHIIAFKKEGPPKCPINLELS